MGVNIENPNEEIIPGHLFNPYTGLFRLPRNLAETTHPNYCLPGRGLFFPASILKTNKVDPEHFPQTAGDYDFTYFAKKNGIKGYINLNAKVYY